MKFLVVMSALAACGLTEKVYHLYCPTGVDLPLYHSEIANGHVLREFENYCQTCENCPWETSHPNFGCNSLFGPYLEDQKHAKDACIIHDMCYESGRSKSSCDTEFKHNFKQLCYESPGAITSHIATGGQIGLCVLSTRRCPLLLPALIASSTASGITNCNSIADIAYYSVRDHGTNRAPSGCRIHCQ
eukprot:GFUD01030946.1.p1 GENE.GFUD01030946.1~~GFUD01030946.1.p1  ORF type:complete len:188 (+),score=11.32 GFUD01030946.1:143-706(+)